MKENGRKAIETLYYQSFSDNTIQAIMPRIWSGVINKTSIMVKPITLKLAQVMNLLTFTEDVNREMIAMLLRQAGYGFVMTNPKTEFLSDRKFL